MAVQDHHRDLQATEDPANEAIRSDDEQDECETSQMASNVMRFCKRNKLKLSSLGLLLYLCLGTVMFEWLDEQQLEYELRNRGVAPAGSDDDHPYNNTRLEYAKRMWNITNKLNILYEANWTRLIVDELGQFEAKVCPNGLSGSGHHPATCDNDDNDQDHDHNKPKTSDGDNSSSIKNQDEQHQNSSYKARRDQVRPSSNNNGHRTLPGSARRRSASLQKWFLYSISSITTLGYPPTSTATPRLGGFEADDGQAFHASSRPSDAMKLAQLAYSVGGLPLLLAGLASSGAQLGRMAPNLLLRAAHWLLVKPVYYLYLCLRACICCLCCCYCCYCCWLPLVGGRGKKRKGRKGLKKRGWLPRCCCPEPEGPPKLRLWRGQVTSDHPVQNNHKTVRFSANTDASLPAGEQAKHKQATTMSNFDEFMINNSANLFAGSLVTLCLYAFSGAYVHSQLSRSSYLDSIIACFSLLTASRMQPPEALHTSVAVHRKCRPSSLIMGISDSINGESQVEWLLYFEVVYMICGLQLISMLLHFGRLWYFSEDSSLDNSPRSSSMAKCNGTLGGSLGAPPGAGLFNQFKPAADHQAEEEHPLELGNLFVINNNPQFQHHQHRNQDFHQHQHEQQQFQDGSGEATAGAIGHIGFMLEPANVAVGDYCAHHDHVDVAHKHQHQHSMFESPQELTPSASYLSLHLMQAPRAPSLSAQGRQVATMGRPRTVAGGNWAPQHDQSPSLATTTTNELDSNNSHSHRSSHSVHRV